MKNKKLLSIFLILLITISCFNITCFAESGSGGGGGTGTMMFYWGYYVKGDRLCSRLVAKYSNGVVKSDTSFENMSTVNSFKAAGRFPRCTKQWQLGGYQTFEQAWSTLINNNRNRYAGITYQNINLNSWYSSPNAPGIRWPATGPITTGSNSGEYIWYVGPDNTPDLWETVTITKSDDVKTKNALVRIDTYDTAYYETKPITKKVLIEDGEEDDGSVLLYANDVHYEEKVIEPGKTKIKRNARIYKDCHRDGYGITDGTTVSADKLWNGGGGLTKLEIKGPKYTGDECGEDYHITKINRNLYTFYYVLASASSKKYSIKRNKVTGAYDVNSMKNLSNAAIPVRNVLTSNPYKWEENYEPEDMKIPKYTMKDPCVYREPSGSNSDIGISYTSDNIGEDYKVLDKNKPATITLTFDNPNLIDLDLVTNNCNKILNEDKKEAPLLFNSGTVEYGKVGVPVRKFTYTLTPDSDGNLPAFTAYVKFTLKGSGAEYMMPVSHKFTDNPSRPRTYIDLGKDISNKVIKQNLFLFPGSNRRTNGVSNNNDGVSRLDE